MSSPVEQALVDKVAEAIWRAGYPRESADRTWRDLVNKTHYRRMAVAAIEALGLRDEWCVGVVYPPREDYPGATVPQQPWPIVSREAAELYKRDKYPDDCYTIHRRLVGPWRTA